MLASIKKIIPNKYRLPLKRIYGNLLWIKASLRYFGNEVYCPICSGRFSNFLPYNGRPGAQCPSCGAVERYRLLWLYLRNSTNFFRDDITVLDIGPVSCFQAKCKRMANIKYVSINISSYLAAVKNDITHISFRDNSFDCIFCYRVLEFIKDDRKAMEELFRVLKPNGWAILQSLIDNKRETTFEPQNPEHFFPHNDPVKRIYGRDYQKKLESVGFKVKPDNFIMKHSDAFIKRHGLVGHEIIYYCSKP